MVWVKTEPQEECLLTLTSASQSQYRRAGLGEKQTALIGREFQLCRHSLTTCGPSAQSLRNEEGIGTKITQYKGTFKVLWSNRSCILTFLCHLFGFAGSQPSKVFDLKHCMVGALTYSLWW